MDGRYLILSALIFIGTAVYSCLIAELFQVLIHCYLPIFSSCKLCFLTVPDFHNGISPSIFACLRGTSLSFQFFQSSFCGCHSYRFSIHLILVLFFPAFCLFYLVFFCCILHSYPGISDQTRLYFFRSAGLEFRW